MLLTPGGVGRSWGGPVLYAQESPHRKKEQAPNVSSAGIRKRCFLEKVCCFSWRPETGLDGGKEASGMSASGPCPSLGWGLGVRALLDGGAAAVTRDRAAVETWVWASTETRWPLASPWTVARPLKRESEQSTRQEQTLGTSHTEGQAEEEKPDGRWDGPVTGALGRPLKSQLCGWPQAAR